MEHYNRYQQTRFRNIDENWRQNPNREREEMYRDNLKYYREQYHDPKNPSYPVPYAKNYEQNIAHRRHPNEPDTRRGPGLQNELAQLRQRGTQRGKGPSSYKRSDELILEDINDRLCDNPYLDASDIEVSAKDGEVILTGTVDDRDAKRMAADIGESVSGVENVENRLRVKIKGI